MIPRIFLVAAPFARLVAKTRGATRIMEGYFRITNERCTWVQIEGESAALVVMGSGSAKVSLDRAEIPRAHAEALLAVTTGHIDCLQTSLIIDRNPVRLSRIVSPGLLDLVTVDFDSEDDARAYQPPVWFGPEVSDDASYRSSTLALQGVPEVQDVEVTNAGLDSLLDWIENRKSRQVASVLTTPAIKKSPAAPPPGPTASDADEAEVATVEDAVIRELARSLSPQRR